MISAEKAEHILKLYEADYDNFLDKLKARRKQKKEESQRKKGEADRADATVKKAEANKKPHLAEKAKKLIDKNGGIEGIKGTVQNVMKYFKTDSGPSDYEVSVGKTDENKADAKTILGMPPMVVYAGGVVIGLLVLYGISKIVSKPQPSPVLPKVTNPVYQPIA